MQLQPDSLPKASEFASFAQCIVDAAFLSVGSATPASVESISQMLSLVVSLSSGEINLQCSLNGVGLPESMMSAVAAPLQEAIMMGAGRRRMQSHIEHRQPAIDFKWMIGGFKYVQQFLERAPVAMPHMLAEGSGMYAQIEGVSSSSVATLISGDVQDASATDANWYEMLTLDAAVMVPFDLSMPSFIVRLSLPHVPVAGQYAELGYTTVQAALVRGEWNMRLGTVLSLRLPSGNFSDASMPNATAVKFDQLFSIGIGADWTLGGRMILEAHLMDSWRPFGLPWLSVPQFAVRAELLQSALQVLTVSTTAQFECSDPSTAGLLLGVKLDIRRQAGSYVPFLTPTSLPSLREFSTFGKCFVDDFDMSPRMRAVCAWRSDGGMGGWTRQLTLSRVRWRGR
ncbi:hypothetical protein OAO87_02035 [bacterium]|nr:hypothetical protein [bacterium]